MFIMRLDKKVWRGMVGIDEIDNDDLYIYFFFIIRSVCGFDKRRNGMGISE